MDRRHFLGGLFAAGGLLMVDKGTILDAACKGGRKSSKEEDVVVILSDLHANPDGYQSDKLKAAVDSILKMKPLPREVIAFGDVAYLRGKEEEYKNVKRILAPLEAAGIGLTLGMGNHDRRENFSKVFPEQVAKSKLGDRMVYVVEGRYADIILLDSLNQGEDNTTWIVAGTMDENQKEWLANTLATYKKPVFVASHHPIHELGISRILLESPTCAGYLYGHNHEWKTGWIHINYSDRRIIRTLCMPSTGHWGDIGFVTFRMGPTQAVAELTMTDFFFPKPLKPGEEKPVDWDEIISEKQNQSCIFNYR